MEKQYLQPIGKMVSKTTKEKTFYNLKISIPFMIETEFYVIKNENRDSDQKPDFLIFYSTNRFGAIWEKTSKKGKKYLYGKIGLIGSAMFYKDLEFSGFLVEGSENEWIILAQNEESENKDTDPF